jgi:hypothetical protein
MAVMTLGAQAPLSLLSTSRTRRNHGVFAAGDAIASVYSSRRAGSLRGVCLEFDSGSVEISGSMTSTQARSLARALMAAAVAADMAGGVR